MYAQLGAHIVMDIEQVAKMCIRDNWILKHYRSRQPKDYIKVA